MNWAEQLGVNGSSGPLLPVNLLDEAKLELDILVEHLVRENRQSLDGPGDLQRYLMEVGWPRGHVCQY